MSIPPFKHVIRKLDSTREETTSRSKLSASIRSMPRWVWPIVDANRALKAAIHGSVAKAATATLRYEAFEARHCVRRLSPATLGVHLRESVRDEQEQAASRIL